MQVTLVKRTLTQLGVHANFLHYIYVLKQDVHTCITVFEPI